MMERAMDRAAALARSREGEITGRIAARLSEMLPSAEVAVEGTDVVAAGTGLLNIWLTDAELRFLADSYE